jgi:cytochrome c biogenesis protein CcdA/thiol-disulfide isomerase/thioredoxin
VATVTTPVGHAQVRPKADTAAIVEHDTIRAGGPARVALQVSLPETFHVQSNKPRDPSLIATELSIDAPPGVTVQEVVFPAATDLKQEGADQPLAVFPHAFDLGVQLAIAGSVAPGDVIVPVHLRYQACDDHLCFPPATANARWTLHVVAADAATGSASSGSVYRSVFDKIAFGHGEAPAAATIVATAKAPGVPSGAIGSDPGSLDRFAVAGVAGGYLGSGDFLKFIHNAESGVRERGLFEGQGPLAILLIVFLGGLALNLTPCVLPMIPINLAIIGAGAQAGSRGRGFLLGSVYGAAMAIVYGVLGLIVILTAGTFGTINSSPWFNLGIAVLFVVLGLAMFDVIEIDLSRYSSGFRSGDKSRGTLLLAFSMGAVAALLAGACVAPVVIEVVLFSSNLYATGTHVALALPFVLGIGMAVPWPVAGAGLSALPKPGAWMVRVKQTLGVVILVTAAYYGYLGYELLSSRWVDAGAVESSVESKIKEGWTPSLAEGLAAAERDHKLVLVDMWATWCKNCLTMDKTTLQNSDVKAALAGYVKVKFQTEDLDALPKDLLQRFEVVGLPNYVILRPKA